MNVVLEALYTLLYLLYTMLEATYRLFVSPPAKSVKDQVVLITGGGKGFGRQTALRLAAKGAILVLWDIDEDSLRETSDDLKASGARVFTHRCDVSSYDDVKKNAEQVRRNAGEVDILINNAGLGICKKITDLSEREIRKTIGVNLMAHFWTLKEFLPAMITRNKGHIVTISSYAGHGGSPLVTDYTASKFAVRGLDDALERELRMQSLMGIKQTIVYPLFARTALVANVASYAKVNMRFGRMLEAEEVADAIVDGIVRNKREVYIPSHGRLLPFVVGAFPWKGRQALSDFMDLRFVSTNT